MMHDLTAQAYELLKDGDGQYIWRPGGTEGAPDRLKGYPTVINNDMAQMAASDLSMRVAAGAGAASGFPVSKNRNNAPSEKMSLRAFRCSTSPRACSGDM